MPEQTSGQLRVGRGVAVSGPSPHAQWTSISWLSRRENSYCRTDYKTYLHSWSQVCIVLVCFMLYVLGTPLLTDKFPVSSSLNGMPFNAFHTFGISALQIRHSGVRHSGLFLVEMFNCIVDTVEDSSSVRSYRKFLIANFCYKYIHKTIKLTEHYNT